REVANRAGFATAGADFGDGFEIALDDGDVDRRRQGEEAGVIELDAAVEEAGGGREDDDAGVEELAAVDARDDPHDGVVKHEAFVHERRPPSTCAAMPGAASSSHDTRGGARRSWRSGARRPATIPGSDRPLPQWPRESGARPARHRPPRSR